MNWNRFTLTYRPFSLFLDRKPFSAYKNSYSKLSSKLIILLFFCPTPILYPILGSICHNAFWLLVLYPSIIPQRSVRSTSLSPFQYLSRYTCFTESIPRRLCLVVLLLLLSLCLSVSFSVFFCLSVSLSLCLCLCLSVSLSLSPPPSLCLSLSPPPLSLSFLNSPWLSNSSDPYLIASLGL